MEERVTPFNLVCFFILSITTLVFGRYFFTVTSAIYHILRWNVIGGWHENGTIKIAQKHRS